MNVAVVGSRDWPTLSLVWEVLDALHAEIGSLTVVSGGAVGVDTAAEQWAMVNKQQAYIYYPQWTTYGKSAGYRRNVQIVGAADLVLAFQYKGSRGTQHSIDIANKTGVPVIVWTEEDL